MSKLPQTPDDAYTLYHEAESIALDDWIYALERVTSLQPICIHEMDICTQELIRQTQMQSHYTNEAVQKLWAHLSTNAYL